MSKTCNFDIFQHFPKFAPLPFLNFEMNPKFDHTPYVYIIKVGLCKVWCLDTILLLLSSFGQFFVSGRKDS